MDVLGLRRVMSNPSDQEHRGRSGPTGALPEVVIREPDSLPYGGEYRGLDGLRRHAAGWMRTWAALQPGNERKLDATFIDAGDHVVACWRLKARAPDGDETLDLPMLGVYELSDGKLVGAQMFYSDTAAVLRFLESTRRARP